ncbi:VOC family protein [uncultured Sphingomonas sp.]|uniref:VOC family protein n=1 Tax=uncultured Sphingomonas sp. TaxID=158754 RepID=UPI0035CA5633
MAVLGALSLTLEVPEIETGVKFYTDAGLASTVEGNVARLRCEGQDRDSIVLLGGYSKKRLHHISLRADDLDGIAARICEHDGKIVNAPEGFEDNGLWIEDPHGMLIHLSEHAADPELMAGNPYEINAPGRVVRSRRSAMLPGASYPAARPLRLGHILVFSPDVPKSVEFVTEALGMGLADRAQDIIAFCCARKDSDHHVVAFAKSPGVGFHHASFQVHDPDEVGRGGRALHAKAGKGDWGFGRHTIGSNFFHYIQDPWGSWFEYYSDMDHIDDYSLWTPTNYDMADSLANWAPEVPHDFVHNYEVDSQPAREHA